MNAFHKLIDCPPGWAKLASMHDELKRYIGIKHDNILTIHASCLHSGSEWPHPTLSLLLNPTPPLSLSELLSNCERLTIPRAKVSFASDSLMVELLQAEYAAQDIMMQLLRALDHLHSNGLIHRG